MGLVKDQNTDNKLKEALAVLISSTHSKKRPLPLTEIAQWLEVAVNRLGSYVSVAERIGLSPKMLRQFSNVPRLSEPVKELFRRRQLDSVDAAAHLMKLPKRQQQAVAKALVAGEIDTADVRAVVQLWQKKQLDPIRTLIQKVKESKTKKEYIIEFVIRGSQDSKSMMTIFRRHLPAKEIVRLELEGSLGRLILTPKGKELLFKYARSLGIPNKHIIPTILYGQEGI
jgi:hypothetical protein